MFTDQEVPPILNTLLEIQSALVSRRVVIYTFYVLTLREE